MTKKKNYCKLNLLNCMVCSKNFTSQKVNSFYCSKECRKKGYYSGISNELVIRTSKICKVCNNKYKVSQKYSTKSLYCSSKCKNSARLFGKSCNLCIKKCKGCEKLFTVKSGIIKLQKRTDFCNKTCRTDYIYYKKNPKQYYKCQQCNKKFLTARKENNKYCSISCSRKYHQIKKIKELSSNYIKQRIRRTSKLSSNIEIPNDLIDLKRKSLTIKRLIR